jgi:hypothetical protein
VPRTPETPYTPGPIDVEAVEVTADTPRLGHAVVSDRTLAEALIVVVGTVFAPGDGEGVRVPPTRAPR